MKNIIYNDIKLDADNDSIFDIKYVDNIIDLVPPVIHKSSLKNNIYYFGYKFKKDLDSKTRTHFIDFIKGLGTVKPSDIELERFIDKPLGALHSLHNMYYIDCFVYPLSDRSNLVKSMISAINNYTSRDTAKVSFELVKSVPQDITFDWETFESENVDNPNYNQMINYIEDILLPKIHDLDYFSIAKNVKPKYRKYISNFLKFKDEATAQKFSALHGPDILIVDDINTSGSTLHEILRIVNSINTGVNIYIYTLIGR